MDFLFDGLDLCKVGQRDLFGKAGIKVIEHLSADLRRAFAQMKGLSPRIPHYLRQFAEA